MKYKGKHGGIEQTSARKKLTIKLLAAGAVVFILGLTFYGAKTMTEPELPATRLITTRKQYLRYNYDSGDSGSVIPVSPCSTVMSDGCVVQCTNLNFDGANTYLNDELHTAFWQGASCCTLKLYSPRFPHGSIPQSWLQLDPYSQPKVTTIELTGLEIEELGPQSFTGLTLDQLTIWNTSITEIRREAFTNASVKTFQMRENPQLQRAEYGLLNEIPMLGTLQVTETVASIDFFLNLTGDKPSHVQVVDWSRNNFRLFKSSLTSNLKSVVSLYLESCSIRHIEHTAFNIPSLKLLVLSRNKLETLSEEWYHPLVERVAIFLNDNQFVCDCKLQWLRGFVQNERNGTYTDFNQVQCNLPKELQDQPFMNVSISCTEPDTTTMEPTDFTTVTTQLTTSDTEHTTASTELTTESTELTTTTTTTDLSTSTTELTTNTEPSSPPDDSPHHEEEVRVNCTAHGTEAIPDQLHSIVLHGVRKTNQGAITILRLAPKGQFFNITEQQEGEINITFENKTQDRTVLMLRGGASVTREAGNEFNCSTNITSRNVVVKNLQPESNYLFCVFDTDTWAINLLDCMPYTTKPEKENRAWLTVGAKSVTTALSIITVLGAFIIGAVLLYCLIRTNPILIKGSKRVVVVKKQEQPQLMVLPRKYLDESKTRTSSSSSGVITDDDGFSTVSYISVIQPSPIELFQYRMERLQARNIEHLTAKPPEIPPMSQRCDLHGEDNLSFEPDEKY